MRYLDRFINFIFSLFILVASAVITLVAAGLIEYQYVTDGIGNTLFSNDNRTITCIVSLVVFLAALKTTVFLSTPNKKKNNIVYVDTNNGKVQIAQETIENTAKNTAKKIESVKDAQARMIKEKKGVAIYMSLLVLPDTNLVELIAKAQEEVKSAVEGSTGVKVNNVDIKIKNAAQTKAKETSKHPIEKEVKVETENVENQVDTVPENTVEPEVETVSSEEEVTSEEEKE